MYWSVSRSEAKTIASVISGQLRVKIKEGSMWLYNFPDKTIHYNPQDLHRLSADDVTANILHEAGHAKYSTSPEEMIWPPVVEQKHKNWMTFLLNVIEDFRIEDLLRKEYPHAKDYLPLYSFKTDALLAQSIQSVSYREEKKKLFYLYCAKIYGEVGGFPFSSSLEMNPILEKAIKETKDACIAGRTKKSTQEIATILGEDVYTHIKHLFPDDSIPRQQVIAVSLEKNPEKIFHDPYEKIRTLIPPTAQKLSKVLKNKQFDKYEGKYKSGKLVNRKLWKAGVGDVRVFSRKVSAKTVDYHFSLLVDESGSMSRGDKIEKAIEGTILFSYTLAKLRIPHTIWGFNTHVRKYYDGSSALSAKQREKIVKTMIEWTNSEDARYNNDGYALKTVFDSIPPSATKRVIFVLSDGHPENGGPVPHLNLREVVQDGMKKGTSIIGMGLGYGGTLAVSNYYPVHLLAENIEMVPSMIEKALRGQL